MMKIQSVYMLILFCGTLTCPYDFINDLHQFSIQDAKERLSALAGRLPSFVDIEVSSFVLNDFCSCLQFDLKLLNFEGL